MARQHCAWHHAGMALPLADLTLAVVGAKFPNKKGPSRIFELEMCHRGELVELRPEPKNPADPNAIAVFSCRGIQIGYLPAERAPRIGQIMQQSEIVAVFQERTDFGAYIRVSFDGSTLDLPLPAEKPAVEPDFRPDPEPDFYPDEEWPDD